jgi:O-antigen/teichoic acid export membrane protein
MKHDLPDPPRPPKKMQPRPRFLPLTDASTREATVQVPIANAGPLRNGARATDTPEPMRQVTTPPPLSPAARSIAEMPTGEHRAVTPSPLRPAAEVPAQIHRAATPPPLRPAAEMPTRTQRAVTPPPSPRLLSFDERVRRRNNAWVPGTSGFDELGAAQPLKTDTFPMMVLRGIAQRQGQAQGEMQSEISGAASGAAIVGFGNIAGTLLKYAGNFIIQRGFGVAIFGLYSLGLSFATLIASLFNMGLDNAMLRYIPIYRGKKNPGALRGLVIFCTAIAGMAGIVGAICMIVFTPQLVALRHVSKDKTMLTTIFILMAPMIPLLCMQTIWFGGLQGFKAFKMRVLSQRLVPAIALIVLLLAALVISHHIKEVLIATLLSTMIGTLLSLFYLFRLVGRQSKQHSGDYEMREWLGFATPNFLTSITDTVLESTDTLLLAFFSVSSFGLGQYAAAIKYSNFIPLPLISLNTMFAPIIAELHSQGEFKKLEAMFKVVTRWTIILSLPIFIVTTVFSAALLAVSGGGFISAWPLLIAFSIGGIINAGTGCVGYMLLMTGHQKLSFMNSVAGIVVNVIFGVILTPRYGAMGTAISTGLAVVVLNLARLLQVRLLLKVQPYSWAIFKPLGAGLISAAIAGGLLYLLYSRHIPLILCLGLVPVFLAMYFGLIVLFKVGPEDQIVVDKLRGKFLRGNKK